MLAQVPRLSFQSPSSLATLVFSREDTSPVGDCHAGFRWKGHTDEIVVDARILTGIELRDKKVASLSARVLLHYTLHVDVLPVVPGNKRTEPLYF